MNDLEFSHMHILNALKQPTYEMFAALESLVGQADANELSMKVLPAFANAEVRTLCQHQTLHFPVKVCAWNIQQMHFPNETLQLLRTIDADILLLSELDMGLNRTAQIASVRFLAKHLGMRYVFVTEFFETKATKSPLSDAFGRFENDLGYHGNAILLRSEILDTHHYFLGEEADWFNNPRTGISRIGQRVALAVKTTISSQNCVFAVVHLESDCGPAGRVRQVRSLLNQLDQFADGLPILLGGDFNAGANTGDFNWQHEQFFHDFQITGFNWKCCNILQATSRHSPIPNAAQQNIAKYDWFFSKNIQTIDNEIVPALDISGQAMSDHDAICTTLKGCG